VWDSVSLKFACLSQNLLETSKFDWELNVALENVVWLSVSLKLAHLSKLIENMNVI
jgi:hypothetical protein